MTTPTITKQLIKLPAAGKGLLSWLAIEGQQVEVGEQVARFTVGNVEHRVDASGTGQLTRTTPDNLTLVGASVIGWVNEGLTGTLKAPSNAPKTPVGGIEDMPTFKPVTPQIRQMVQPEAPKMQRDDGAEPTIGKKSARRNTHVADLVIEDLTPPKRKPPKKRKMVNRTYSIAPDDEDEITRLVAALGKMRGAPVDVNESLLVRVAIAQLVKSAKSVEGVSALIEAIEDRIKVEASAGVGAGRRRKSKSRVL